MRRGIGRLRAGGAGGFTPLTAFAGGKKGLWIAPDDQSAQFQDSAGATPVTASGQFVGKSNDKSGNANHVTQSGATARPEWDLLSGIASHFTDGVNDGYSSAVVAAGTFSAAMDCFITIKRATAGNMVICSQEPASGTSYFGVVENGSATVSAQSIGAAWTMWVDGVQVGGTANTTRGQLHTALGSGAYHVFEVRDMNMAAWTQFTAGLYTAFMLNADIAQIVLCESQSSLRNQLRTYCGAKGGLTL